YEELNPVIEDTKFYNNNNNDNDNNNDNNNNNNNNINNKSEIKSKKRDSGTFDDLDNNLFGKTIYNDYAVRNAFLRLFISLLRNYKDYIIIPNNIKINNNINKSKRNNNINNLNTNNNNNNNKYYYNKEDTTEYSMTST